MTIALVDYGIGNLRSVKKALEAVGAKVVQTNNPSKILDAEKVVLPGVGAFQDGMIGLQQQKLVPTLQKIFSNQTPLLGICLGMQLFFESSSEMGNSNGLGFLRGTVRKFPNNNLKIPQTGWNQLKFVKNSDLLNGVEDEAYVYFNHSYYCDPYNAKDVLAQTSYGLTITVAVQRGSLYGVQFHPEKSQNVGLQILKNFVERCT